MSSWNRRQQWDQRNLRRRRMSIFGEPREHYSTCNTQCVYLYTVRPENCDLGHSDHECNCADIAAAFYEAAAEALDARQSGNPGPLLSGFEEGFDSGLPAVVIRKEVNTQDAVSRQPGASCDAAGLNRRSGQY